MTKRNSLIDRRNRLIYEDYATLWATCIREEFIWPHLSLKWHLEEATLYRIVLKHKKGVSNTEAGA